MKNLRNLFTALAFVAGFSAVAFSQTNGEEQQAISKARQAASDCISRPDLAGLQITYNATVNMICDFLPGVNTGAIFGYQVDVYAEGHCPGNIRELCDPVFLHVATVFVSCGDAQVTEVICH